MSETNGNTEKQQDTAEQDQEKNVVEERDEDIYSIYEDYSRDELIEMLHARQQQVEELEKELSEAKDAHLRKAAELENYKKRVQKERTQVYETAKANALRDFLSINDDLQRTLKASEDLDVNPTFLDGVNLVASKFEDVLKNHGVERIDEKMVPFDVDLHDAMMRRKPEEDNIDSDIVLDVIENGYRMGDRTIRHAKVIVSE
ncbi:nucleotide exchange factor GrpE [Balneolaceae bacterium YR4-1]|uniref:Protein GrpE n=1 Tax=Halalkalibaculum roseum TaxID=2709311 RepID=A0A6M1SVG5_9BACT|nr:nucleotide exchange factor GrpE [Halalkalibaculum roseum]NGP76842.1 nucleotide exchange factor GrpE [Halalkalibaculum roseum]